MSVAYPLSSPFPRLLLTLLLLTLCTLAQGEEWVYRMRAGETLSGISARFLRPGITPAQLQAHNQIIKDRQIPIGTEIHVPLAWLKQSPAQAEVLFLHGQVSLVRGGIAPRTLTAPEPLRVGDQLTTGEDGVLGIRFADGSRLLLGPASQVTLDTLSAFGETGMVDTRVRVQRGRVESRVKPLHGEGSRYEIHTPAAVTMVRGTGFRVAVEGASGLTRSEVVKGRVAVAAAGATVEVAAGFGTLVEPGKPPSPPSRLLDPPDLAQLPARLTAGGVELSWPSVAGAEHYRLQLLATNQPDEVLREVLTDQPSHRFAALAAGDYLLRLRAIDARGLEGLSAQRSLTVEPAPPPPAPTPTPVAEAPPRLPAPQLYPPRFLGGWMEFRWDQVQGAWGYRLILAKDAAMHDSLLERIGSDARLLLPQPWRGRFYVRVDALFPGDSEETHSQIYRIEIPRP